jgi:small-conductance mechanosensitive channel
VTPTPAPGVGPAELFDYWPTLLRLGWFLVAFLVVALLGRLLVEPTLDRVVRSRNRNNPRLRDAFSLYFRALVVVIAAVAGATVAGYGRFLGSSALIVGAVTLALGVAGQEVIGSLISGTALVFDPEFNVGNYIEWDGGAGTVRSISLRVTRVETPDGELVTVPNTILTGGAVSRPFGRGDHRVVERIGIGYDDDVDEALRLLEATATDLDATLADPAPRAYVEELGSDAVVLNVHYWIEDPERRDLLDVRSAFAREAKARLDDAGITVSPPSTRDLRGRVEVDAA